MKTASGTYQADSEGVDFGRRNALKLTGLSIATLGVMPLFNPSIRRAAEFVDRIYGAAIRPSSRWSSRPSSSS